MSNLLVPLSFNERREPLAQKVQIDGERMYNHARYVIVLDIHGTVIESFENPPFGNIVDCLVVLAPVRHRSENIEKSVVLEIGFRRFLPFAKTEYRPDGKPERTPRFKGKVNPKKKIPRSERGRTEIIYNRVPVARLSDALVEKILPEVCIGVQNCVNSIISEWKNSVPIQTRGQAYNSYVHIASIFVRIKEEEKLLCAVARFGEIRYRLTGTRTLASTATLIKKLSKRFISQHELYKTQQGDYLNRAVKNSEDADFIAQVLSLRIKYRGYTKQMIDRMLTLVGKGNSNERKLIDQIWRIHKIPQPKVDEKLSELEKSYGAKKRKLLARWKLENFISHRHEKRRVIHAQNCLTISVLGSHEELMKVVVERDKRKMQKETSECDADIPF